MTKQEQLIIILLIIAALIGTGLLYHRKFFGAPVTPGMITAKDNKVSAEGLKEIVVDVKGACWRPGVYTLTYGARVSDVLERVCPREDADLSGINLARRLRDGEGIYIPERPAPLDNGYLTGRVRNNGEVVQESKIFNGANEQRYSANININKAGREDLERLPDIGPKIAAYIVEYRNTHGLFKEISEIKNVEKIGEKTFQKIKDLITVE